MKRRTLFAAPALAVVGANAIEDHDVTIDDLMVVTSYGIPMSEWMCVPKRQRQALFSFLNQHYYGGSGKAPPPPPVARHAATEGS